MYKIFYHSIDFDGYCSAAITVKYCRENNIEFELFPINYGNHFPWNEIDFDDTIVMVDFSLSIKDMEALNQTLPRKGSGGFIWIDHHEIIDEAKEKKFNPFGLRSKEKAACELAWEYFFPKQDMPKIVHLLGRYDAWDHKNPDVLAFQEGIKMSVDKYKNPEHVLWEEYICHEARNNCSIYIDYGNIILKYKEQQAKIYCEANAFEVEFEGYKAIAVNIGHQNSYFADSVIKDHHDLIIYFHFAKDRWKYSLRSTKINVAELAKKHGGGGHKGAAGFESPVECFLTPSF
jgi:oligoribonuclease NrnB/cAMP/cGMP phosphodiesterase (DHH superfamily)